MPAMTAITIPKTNETTTNEDNSFWVILSFILPPTAVSVFAIIRRFRVISGAIESDRSAASAMAGKRLPADCRIRKFAGNDFHSIRKI
jgi:hypothetical protein